MQTQKTTLDSGLRVLSVHMPESLSTTVLILVGVGSIYENPTNAGISHFLEHMCFKGTTKRPRARDITRELDGIGASYNAFTAREFTGYYAKAASRHMPQLVDVIADIYLHSTFPEDEVAKEKGVIVEEINMYEDVPQEKVWDIFFNLMYPNQSLGRPIIGSKETVNSFTREHIAEFHRTMYTPQNTLVVVAGPHKHEDVSTEVSKYLGAIREETAIPEVQKIPTQFGDTVEINLGNKKTDQTHIVFGLPGYSISDPRAYAFRLLTTILGGGMSSRLFEKVREDMGAAYYVGASADSYVDIGHISIYAGLDTKRLPEVVKAIKDEVILLREQGITEEELRRAKEQIIGSITLGLETSDQYADYIAFQELLRKEIRLPKEHIDLFEKVTVAEVNAIAKELLIIERAKIALIGPFESKEEVAHLARS